MLATYCKFLETTGALGLTHNHGARKHDNWSSNGITFTLRAKEKAKITTISAIPNVSGQLSEERSNLGWSRTLGIARNSPNIAQKVLDYKRTLTAQWLHSVEGALCNTMTARSTGSSTVAPYAILGTTSGGNPQNHAAWTVESENNSKYHYTITLHVELWSWIQRHLLIPEFLQIAARRVYTSDFTWI